MPLLTDQIATDASGWDMAGDYGDIQLYGATLVVDTPKLKKGTKVGCIAFIFSKSICEVYSDDGKEVIDSFPLTLRIG